MLERPKQFFRSLSPQSSSSLLDKFLYHRKLRLVAHAVQEILPFCRLYRIASAEACLYERLGDVNAALQIYTEEALESMRNLLELVQKASMTESAVQELLDDQTPQSQLMPRNSRETQDQDLASAVCPYLLTSRMI